MNITKAEYDEVIKQSSYPINVSKYFKKTHQITTVDVKNALHLLVKNNPNSFSRTSGVPYGFDNPSFPKYYYKEQPKAVSGTEFIEQATVSYPQSQASQAPVASYPQPQVSPINVLLELLKNKNVKVFIDGSSNPLLHNAKTISFSKNDRNPHTVKTDDVVVTMSSFITTHSIRESLEITYVILSKYKGFTALIPLLKVTDNRNIIYVESYEELLVELNKL
jgi:hypothetical protein